VGSPPSACAPMPWKLLDFGHFSKTLQSGSGPGYPLRPFQTTTKQVTFENEARKEMRGEVEKRTQGATVSPLGAVHGGS
jgi:hypothetical protein